MTPREKTYFHVLIITLFACGAVLLILRQLNGYYRDLNYEKTEETLKSISSQRKNPSAATSTNSSNVVVGWKTYRNDELGFGFTYPKEWSLELNDGTDFEGVSFGLEGDDLGSASVYISRKMADYDVFFHNKDNGVDVISESVKNINGINWKIITTAETQEPTVKSYHAYTIHNKYTYLVSGRDYADDQNFINNILSTFKFTK